MKSLYATVQFLTRLPLPAWPAAARRPLRAHWFGVVGLVIGALLAALDLILRPWLPIVPRIVVVLACNALLTGGMHLDGLADTADALGGFGTERALAIMRDSRIGSYGVLALLAAWGLQASLLCALPPAALTAALFLAPGWGRASMAVSAALSRPARPDGLGAAFIGAAGVSAAGLGALAALTPVVVAALLCGGRPPLIAGLAALLLAASFAAVCRRRFGGQTGDTLGALNVIVETVAYGAFVVLGGAA
ncbi:MAG TPA: adenosylcobinamide-GDP ribazoletransferase [Terriglobales bacterium]|nr:adenosylcobinamide-GDP ribazoletransferase [Terriglobales bacterium]